MNKIKNKLRRGIAGSLAAVVMLSAILTDFPSFNAFAENKYTPGMTMLSGSADWKFFCIDSYELLHEAGGVQGTNEWYAYVVPSTRLSSDEVATLFWATLSLRAAKGDSTECKGAIDKINANAPAQGLPPITKVTEADMKTIIHLKSTRDKYPWLDTVIANADKYMDMAGLLGGSGDTSTGGKPIPTILQNHKDLSTALPVDVGTFTIQFDPMGADKDFIQKVPLKFSSDGGEFKPELIGGWTYQKTDTSIIFTNPNPKPPKLLVQFDTAGTEYQKNRGYASVQEAYDTALQLWVCIECNDRHIYHSQKKMPLEAHQRLTYLVMDTVEQNYFAAIAGDPNIPGIVGNEVPFVVYRHEEDMESTYNVQLYKYDHETGEPLENAAFKLYERFDDKDQIDLEKDGPVHIFKGGEPYKSYHKDNPAVWDGFRSVSGLATDENGHASKTINHGYHYDKTFCDGHPAPVFLPVPEAMIDPESGEQTNEDAITQAQGANKAMADRWLRIFNACEAHASGDFNGVHFHWLMPEVDRSVIEDMASNGGDEGETPAAGQTASATGEVAYQRSGCQSDTLDTYDKFIALRYSYALVESKARDGYTLHGNHADDLPVEVITTDSSENGANSVFAGMYGKDITINDTIPTTTADETLAKRERIASYQLKEEDFGKPEDTRLTKDRKNYRQEIVRFLMPEVTTATASDAEEAAWADMELIDDLNGNLATPSNAAPSRYPSKDPAATPSDADRATPSNATAMVRFSKEAAEDSDRADGAAYASGDEDEGGEGGSSGFTEAYNTALNGESSGPSVTPGPSGNYSHCDDTDGEGDAWRIYDHRTEGEIHINKRDMDLEAGQDGGYDSYGDSQGDGTLEGAAYGLFAAADIIHPDGKTGTVYKANSLVAIAATDKEGDASFLVNTEAPGYHYDYESGQVAPTEDGWAQDAPKNLYVDSVSYDDYTPDGEYERTYQDNEGNNGNAWIGRPLLMGDYYIKELTRSEGYELSIGNRDNALTNNGQDYGMTLPTGTGYAAVSRGLYAEGQISAAPTGEYGDPDINELFFTAESRGTGAQGFDLVLSNVPAGARLYRLDTGTEIREVETGTGVFDKVYLTNEDGSPKYVTAENDYQYPKYNPDGSLMTTETSTDYHAGQMLSMPKRPLDTGKTQAAMEGAEPSMTKEEVAAKLATDFSEADKNFLKGKVERALRANGRTTPYTMLGGNPDHSSIYVGVYDAGVREGERDDFGISGVQPGEPAARTVYGVPVVTLEVPMVDGAGMPLKVGDAILTVLDYYNTNSFYSYGGVHDIAIDGGNYLVTLYASCYGTPANFIVLGSDPEDDSTIHHRVPYLPDDAGESPRYIYATYSNNPEHDAFGTYTDYKGEVFGGTYFASATLVTDAVAKGDGTLASKTVIQNVYYQTGETPLDEDGEKLRAFEYVEQTTTTQQEVEVYTWSEVPVQEADGKTVAHMDSSYTDHYGKAHDDTELLGYSMRVLLPEKKVTLSQADIESMVDPGDWTAGEAMGSASYYRNVQHAKAKAYLNYKDLSLVGDSTFVKQAQLTYPGQEYVLQDGKNRPGTNTIKDPIPVQERPIKQTIKIIKTIDKDSYQAADSYQRVHEDWFTRLFAKKGKEAETMENFRFKAYLKSNLERLYRDEDGQIVWMDKNGNVVDINTYRAAFPEKVQKIYTKVPHTPDIKKNSEETIIANRELYSFSDGLIQKEPNPGYTSILERLGVKEQTEAEQPGTLTAPNYPKFFDAIHTSNMDRWDNPLTHDRKFSTWKEWDSVRNAWDGQIDPSIPDTSFKPFARIPAGRYSSAAHGGSTYPAIHDGSEQKNEINTSTDAKKNAMSSDAVRQFAITWYLEEEVKKLVQSNTAGETTSTDDTIPYPDQVYDTALAEAIEKANHYLTPFFHYDLDAIYSIAWDEEADGGKDGDATTLCADVLGEDSSEESYYYGISAYLPYGTYVTVEQQPYNHEEGQYDFYNKHYRTDTPKEVILPSVYEPGEDTDAPGALSKQYTYQSARTPEEVASAYQIRFHEEWADNHTDDRRGYVIRAHNASGDFEVYKYGLDVDRLTGTTAGADYAGWKVTQDTYDPLKDYYNAPLVNTKEEGGNPDSHYYADDQNRPPYPADAIEKRYHYASISEDAGLRDNVPTMTGEQTAYEGKYAPMLVPWTVTKPIHAAIYDGEMFSGHADSHFQNTFYGTKLRIEKLDSETGESILHDQAIFALYAAARDDSQTGEGLVKFYETPTVIVGTRQFLEAMGASRIHPLARDIPDPQIAQNTLYYGTVPEGTPICREAERIVLQDQAGSKTGEFRAFTTMRDGTMAKEAGAGVLVADQNTGYLELPQQLGAGVYVLAEIKPPSGYVRTRPVAIEVYSDRVTYYMDGNRDNRVAAAIYEEPLSRFRSSRGDEARIYIGNTPIRLEVSKKKSDAKTVTFRLSGRVEGTVTELNGRYGLENLELAYNSSGTYLGYGWQKGTAEHLAARKTSATTRGETVEILYESGVFSGCANITRPLLTAEDKNRYVAGATLTLYDAIAVERNGDSQDFAFDGVTVERDRNSNITRMYVKKGYAGTKTVFNGQSPGRGRNKIWSYRTVQRPDTDILFYNLGNLDVMTKDSAGNLWSHGKDGKPLRIVHGVTPSIYAMLQGRPVFEIVTGDFGALEYRPQDKAFTEVAPGTVLYHLNAEGQRDALVDPYTGMAYVEHPNGGRGGAVMVWPVHVIKDQDENILAVNKRKTSRIATIHADTEQEYVIGTYNSRGNGSFEKRLNPVLDRFGLVTYYQRSDEAYRKSSPVYDRDGEFAYDRYEDNLNRFNQNAYMIKAHESVFDKGVLWDERDNRNEPLFMRQGDHYILENTWVSGERTPNDPFDTGALTAHADMLKRVFPGTYILEELEAPDGYARAFPAGVAVTESAEIQRAELTDDKMKVEISKIDAPNEFHIEEMDYDGIRDDETRVAAKGQTAAPGRTRTEKKGAYTYLPVAGAKLALFRAKKVYTSDTATYPAGWYPVKTESIPASWTSYDVNNSPVTVTATWTSTKDPFYLEGIPAGTYLLEELLAPPGYVPTTAWVDVKSTGEVQTFQIANDHTKLEIYKYQTVDGKKEPMPNRHAAGLSLYRATTDENGKPILEQGLPVYQEDARVASWTTDDCRQYTTLTDLSLYQKWGFWKRLKLRLGFGRERYSGFEHDYEAMYREYGTEFDELHWFYTDEPYDGSGELPNLREGIVRLVESQEADQSSCVTQLWELKDGRNIRITIAPVPNPLTGESLTFEYQYHYQKLEGNMVSYDTREGCHRIDYISWEGTAGDGGQGAAYVLAETVTPDGYETALPKLILLHETADVQLYAMENTPEPTEPEKPEEPEEPTPEETTAPPPTEPETTEPPTKPEEPTEPEPTPPQTEPETPQIPEEPDKPDHPPEPEGETTAAEPTEPEPKEPPLIGRITARYDGSRQDGAGTAKWYQRRLSRTGDPSFGWLWLALSAVSGIGLLIGVRRRMEEKSKHEKE